MQIAPTRHDAFQLMFDGCLALSKVQSNGMVIDTQYCTDTMEQVGRDMQDIEDNLLKLDEVKYWQRKYNGKFKLGSDTQLSHVLFDHMNITPTERKTKGGGDSVDAEALEEIYINNPLPMIKEILLYRKLDKARGTYLAGLLREVSTDGLLHPFFHLHKVITYRSSSSGINFQNIPTRDALIKKLIRTAFRPRKGRQILETDFKGIEVGVSACYHKDPNMLDYLWDPSKDMHRDMAMQLYVLNEKEWNKKSRHAGKNGFVFPEFYGSYFKQVAPHLWKMIALNDLHIGKDNKGITLYEHLAKKGIHDKEQFEKHVQRIEEHFWGERFAVYAQWKEDWVEQYYKRGWFESYSGFRYYGLFKRNEVINYPVQGAAFHCLLWTLTQLQNWLEKNRMKTLIIGQIHDSIVLDVVPSELDDVLAFIVDAVTYKLKEHWPWIIAPMSVEAELAGIDEPWLNKKEIDLSKYARSAA